jgi:hypothetical protein
MADNKISKPTNDNKLPEEAKAPSKDNVSSEPKAEEENESKPEQITSFRFLDADKNSFEEKKSEKKGVGDEDEDKQKYKPSQNEVSDWIKDAKPKIETSEPPKSSKVKYIVILIILLVFAVGGYFLISQRNSNPIESTQEEIITPSPADLKEDVSDEADISIYSVSILNGSGIAGEAANIEDIVTELGLENIKTGNAETYDFEKTTISYKGTVDEKAMSLIEEKISEKYETVLTNDPLEDSSSFDIIIIVGKSKATS